VLFRWGHAAHGDVEERIVDLVQRHVWQGMGLVCLHSAHFSKVFRRLTGAPCALRWREAGERERLWVVNPAHDLVQGIGPYVELEQSEMYGEPFTIPEPDETIFMSWFEGGDVFRSGVTFRRGNGKIFYFSPGHEMYPIYHQAEIKQILKNAARWAAPDRRFADVDVAANAPIEKAPEPIQAKGPRLHGDGEEGLR
jgi:trehalose utilization protein